MASAQTVARASDALRTLRERFRETSAGTITMLEELARQLGTEPTSPDAITALRRELHRVHGTAGSYGFAEASRLAAKLEQRVGDWENDPALERTQRATIIGHFVSDLPGQIELVRQITYTTPLAGVPLSAYGDDMTPWIVAGDNADRAILEDAAYYSTHINEVVDRFNRWLALN